MQSVGKRQMYYTSKALRFHPYVMAGCIGMMLLFLAAATLAAQQPQTAATAPQAPAAAALAQIPPSEMSEVAFKNVQVLREFQWMNSWPRWIYRRVDRVELHPLSQWK